MEIYTEIEIDPYKVLNELDDKILVDELYSRDLEDEIFEAVFGDMSADEVSKFLWNYLFHRSKEEIGKIKDVVDFHYNQWKGG